MTRDNATTPGAAGAQVTPPGKHPRTVLAGPYGHPFHPILVTVPIGAWIASLVFDLAALGSDREATFAEGAFWLLVLGIVGAVLAALFGVMDLLTIPTRTRAHTTALTHMALNTAALIIFTIDVLVRWSNGHDDATGAGLALTVAGLAVVSVSGWLGGKLSYHYGVRVADEQTQAEGFSH